MEDGEFHLHGLLKGVFPYFGGRGKVDNAVNVRGSQGHGDRSRGRRSNKTKYLRAAMDASKTSSKSTYGLWLWFFDEGDVSMSSYVVEAFLAYQLPFYVLPSA